MARATAAGHQSGDALYEGNTKNKRGKLLQAASAAAHAEESALLAAKKAAEANTCAARAAAVSAAQSYNLVSQFCSETPAS